MKKEIKRRRMVAVSQMRFKHGVSDGMSTAISNEGTETKCVDGISHGAFFACLVRELMEAPEPWWTWRKSEDSDWWDFGEWDQAT